MGRGAHAPSPAKPMKASDRMPATIRLIAVPVADVGQLGQLELLADAGHQHQRQREARAGAEREDQALQQP